MKENGVVGEREEGGRKEGEGEREGGREENKKGRGRESEEVVAGDGDARPFPAQEFFSVFVYLNIKLEKDATYFSFSPSAFAYKSPVRTTIYQDESCQSEPLYYDFFYIHFFALHCG